MKNEIRGAWHGLALRCQFFIRAFFSHKHIYIFCKWKKVHKHRILKTYMVVKETTHVLEINVDVSIFFYFIPKNDNWRCFMPKRFSCCRFFNFEIKQRQHISIRCFCSWMNFFFLDWWRCKNLCQGTFPPKTVWSNSNKIVTAIKSDEFNGFMIYCLHKVFLSVFQNGTKKIDFDWWIKSQRQMEIFEISG